MERALAELERRVHAALETYSNVHRGSGHKSMVSTYLFEKTRKVILEYLSLNRSKYEVIFCTPGGASALIRQLKPESYQIVSSLDIGLSLGVRAIAVKRKSLPRGSPFQPGGGTTKLVSQNWVIWADAPGKFEAGTPAIVNIIAFGIALELIRRSGNGIFLDSTSENLTAAQILYRDELEGFSGKQLLEKLRPTIIGRGILVPTAQGITPYINLDNSASTPTFKTVWNSYRQTWRQPLQVQQEIIHEVRSICADIVEAPLSDYDVIFTSNTTEAINLAAQSLSHLSEDGPEPVVLNTLLEHSSNDLPWRKVKHCKLIRLSTDAEGFVDLDELETLMRAYNHKGLYGKRRIKLVAISGASNVLGVCNNMAEISQIVKQYGAELLVDAAQLIAHRKVHMKTWRIDYLAFSAHKIYAPFGCGVLIAKKGLLNFSSIEMEKVHLSGEENVAGVAALGKAFVLMQRIGMDLIREEEQALTRTALRKMSMIPGLKIYGIKDPDSPRFAQKLGVIVFELNGMMANRVSRELAIRGGIGVRHGCHCAHILIKQLLNVSPLLERFQGLIQTLFPKTSFPGLVRISLGIENNEEDIEKMSQSLNEIIQNTQVLSNVKQQMNDFVRDSSVKVFPAS